MLSWSGYVPNQFSRTCTNVLKLQTTRMFLRDWLACKDLISRLGHWESTSQVDQDALYDRHIRSNGSVPKDIYLAKKAFVLARPVYRPEQRYEDFTDASVEFENASLVGRAYGGNASFGPRGVEYVAFIGLRGDEEARVQRVWSRALGAGESRNYEGEHVYMPLSDMCVSKEDVNAFWQKNQNLELKLPNSGHLSNCVFCFLKGTSNLIQAYKSVRLDHLNSTSNGNKDTPMDVSWWARIEEQYGRDLQAEGRERTSNEAGVGFLGFFGMDSGITYRAIAEHGIQAFDQEHPLLPCDCTD